MSKKKILVIYYSQSGQLKRITDSILQAVGENESVEITYEALKPSTAYPFPWTSLSFCDAQAEAVAGIPCALEPLNCDLEASYDMVVIAYTIWFLAPSTPLSAFLQSPEAKKLLHNCPVMTIIGCRNMWVMAQERVKQYITEAGGRLTGNIVLADRAHNLIGIMTIAYWMLTGKKGRFLNIFPKPGVAEEDIEAASRFGEPINRALEEEVFSLNQKELNEMEAVKINPTILTMEKRVSRIFKIWSGYIRKKGGPADPKRRGRVRGFFYYLLFVIIFILPIVSVISFITGLFNRKARKKEINYYTLNICGEANAI